MGKYGFVAGLCIVILLTGVAIISPFIAPSQSIAIETSAIHRDSGFAFAIPLRFSLPFPFEVAADDFGSEGSDLQLMEDNRPLGPAHTLHDEIRTQGKGRYSHWRQDLWFSTSDNTDPRTNGRRYDAIAKAQLSNYFIGVVLFFDFVFIALFYGRSLLRYAAGLSGPTHGIHFMLRARPISSALIMMGSVTAILVTLCSIFPPRWESNDDIAMSMAAHGYGLSAIGTADLVFSNVVWGYVVRAMPTVLETLGYSVATLVVLAIVGAAVTLGVGLLSGRVLIGISAGLLIMVRPVLFPQFTLNAGLLAAAAIVCWHLYDRHRNPIPLVAGCTLALTGFIVRDLECLLVLAIAFPIMPWRCLLWRQGGRIAMIATIAVAGAATILDQRAYRTPEWASFNTFNQARLPFTDYGAAEALLQQPEIPARHGYSLNDITLLQNWFFVGPAIANPAELRAMVRELPLAPTRRSISNLWAALQAFWHPSLLPLGLVALMLGVLRPSWKVAASWLLCCLAVIVMGYVGRPGILRVYVPLVSLLVIAPIVVDRDTQVRRAMTFIVAAGALFGILQVTSQSHHVHVGDEAVRSGLNGFPNEPVVVWGADLPYEALYPVLGKSPAQDFRLYSLATFTYAPFSVAMVEEKAGRGFVNRLTSQAGLPFIVSGRDITLLKVYCQEHLKATLEQLEERQYGRLTLQRYRCVPTAT
jgi:hypothetical protein